MGENCAGHHCCEPPYYPAALGESWQCPECGQDYSSFRVADHRERLRIPDFMPTPPDSYGWTSSRRAHRWVQ